LIQGSRDWRKRLDYYNRNQLGEIYVDVTDMPYEDCVLIKFARYIDGKKHCANFVKDPNGVTVIKWEAVEEGQVIPDHLKLRVSRDTARFLMEGFQKILNFENRPNKQLTTAMQQHIDDLRTIAFFQIGVDKDVGRD
jgi:hypothetical protein